MSENKVKKKLSALDYFIIILLVISLSAVGLQMYFTKINPKSLENLNRSDSEDEEYIISYLICGMRSSSASTLEKAEHFYCYDNTNKIFGEPIGNLSITPAEIYIEDQNGIYKKTYAVEKDDMTSVDVRGTMKVKGYYDENNLFKINGETYAAPGKTLTAMTGTIYVSFFVTDIVKVQ